MKRPGRLRRILGVSDEDWETLTKAQKLKMIDQALQGDPDPSERGALLLGKRFLGGEFKRKGRSEAMDFARVGGMLAEIAQSTFGLEFSQAELLPWKKKLHNDMMDIMKRTGIRWAVQRAGDIGTVGGFPAPYFVVTWIGVNKGGKYLGRKEGEAELRKRGWKIDSKRWPTGNESGVIPKKFWGKGVKVRGEALDFGRMSETLTALRESLDEQDQPWWKAVFGHGRVFFQAGSASHAQSIAAKWGKENDMGKPDVVKKAAKPRDLDRRGYFTKDGPVYVEQ